MRDVNIELAERIAEAAAHYGGTAYYVGGYVRDRLRGKENKDIDIEIHGVTPAQLRDILDSTGQRLEIGKSFGVFGLRGYTLDISMPRKETNRGSGHKDFDICVDPFIGTYGAAKRRDFTINAMMQNVLTGEIVDHFDGKKDLESGVIRHVSADTFAEDPLRVLRAAQLASRLGFGIADETESLCRRMDVSALPKERVMGELEKAMLKSEKPSAFFEALRRMDQLSAWFPELEALIGVQQNPRHHAEGDVWTHTMMVLDVAAGYRDGAKDPLGFLLSAVTHDFGKAVCTAIVNGEIHAYNHETAGIPLADSFMRRLTDESALIKYVLNLTEHHMKPNVLAADKASVKSSNKMFDRSVDPEALIYLARADGLGKTAQREYVSYDDFFDERLKTFREYMSRPYVTGRDLIAAGLEPGEKFSEYLAFAHKLRLAGVSKEDALKQTLAMARKDGKL